jgi:hypothetical protein
MTKYKKGPRYITFLSEQHSNGGIGHCLNDYISCVIISEIFPDTVFVNNKFHIQPNIGRNMLVSPETTDWFNFLNLSMLSSLNLDSLKKNLEFNKINVKKTTGARKNNRYQNIDLEYLKKNLQSNKLNYLTNNNRIYLFDLYYYEKLNIVPQNSTLNIVNKLKQNFYTTNKKMKKQKKIINVYLRRGDFQPSSFLEEFTLKTLNLLYEHINEKDKYTINIISAGQKNEMDKIREEYNKFNPNFLFNQNEKEVFYLMTQSDILLFYNSTFSFTASLLCDGKIIKKKDDDYLSKMVKFNDMRFLNNYIITDNFTKEDICKLGLK